MRRPTSILGVATIVVLLALPVLAAPAGAQASATAGVPTSIDDCRHSGWRTSTDPVGGSWSVRAACIKWVRAHPGGALGLADLAGTFTGTEAVVGSGCDFVHRTFDASYATRGRVGTASLAIDGCTDSTASTYTGTFTITTPVGSVSGTAAGAVSMLSRPPLFNLYLTPTSGTGAFTTTSGILGGFVRWIGYPDGGAINGTVVYFPPI